MKLVEILAREWKNWPVDSFLPVSQSAGGGIYVSSIYTENGATFTLGMELELSDDFECAEVTRAQWEAERVRILAESSKLTEQDKEHVSDLTAIACGKRSKEDLALWDKAYFRAWELGIEDGIKQSLTLEYLEVITTGAVHMADRFMAERAKRMKG